MLLSSNSWVRLADLPTPCVLIERTRVLNNIHRMQEAVAARSLRLRPHVKTHKSPTIARWQLDAGASGITVAKVGEAEVFVDAGVPDIRLAYPIPPTTSVRLLALMDRARVSIIVDHAKVAAAWSRVMSQAGRVLDVLVKVDVGFHRCGIDGDDPGAVDFIVAVASLGGLRFRGLLSHAGQSYTASSEAALAEIARTEALTLRQLADAVRARGVDVDEVSVGATPTVRYSLDQPGITELRPGNYVFFDLTQVALGAASVRNCALSVLATVVSAPTDDRLILDAGSKTLSSDGARGTGAPPGYGSICADLTGSALDSSFVILQLSEEHAIVKRRNGQSRLEPGNRVRIIPNHACVVANLADTVQLVNGDVVTETIRIAARGKNS